MSGEENNVYDYVNDAQETKRFDSHPPPGRPYINYETRFEENEAYNRYSLSQRNHPDECMDNKDGGTCNQGSPPYYANDFRDDLNEVYNSCAPPSRRAFADPESGRKVKSGRQRSVCILCSFAVGFLLILVLGIAGVSAYNLYDNITNHDELTVVEANDDQAVILHVVNLTENDTFEVVLEEFIESVQTNLSRIYMDISSLGSNVSNRFVQISGLLESVHNDLQRDISRLNSSYLVRVARLNTIIDDLRTDLEQIEESSATKEELKQIELRLGILENEVNELKVSEPNSDRSLTYGHPLLLAMMGLMAVISVHF